METNTHPNNSGAQHSFRKFRLILIGLFAFPLFTVAGFIVFVLATLPPMEVIENPKSDVSTQIISADGKLLGSIFHEEHRIVVSMDEISPNVIKCLIATEDIRFYEHSGVDLKAVLRAILNAGREGGGSTITMQLARNLYDQVGKERSVTRKLKEMVFSIILESRFTKEEIIAAYLNTVSFYGNSYGIENGAQIFFGKKAADLNVQESALMVGLLKGPAQYNPIRHPDAALNRRNTVLEQMQKYDFLSSSDADSLKKLPIQLEVHRQDHNTGPAPYFREHLRKWLEEWAEKKGYNIYTDGLRVHTTIDSRMQTHAEEAIKEHLTELQQIFDKHVNGRQEWKKDSTILTDAMKWSNRWTPVKTGEKTAEQVRNEFYTPVEMTLFSWNGPFDTVMTPMDSLKYYAQFLETGFMAIDPVNGEVKAWVGGIDHTFFKYDHVYEGKRQVGSTFKPFVYAAAFDNGFSPCDEELNQPVFFEDEKGNVKWSPKNADGKIGGKMTLRKGLATSTNLITARLMKSIGPEVVCNLAYKMGITSNLDCVPSLCLGTTDLSVFELISAYCPFANQGIYHTPIFVTRIEDKNGNLIEEFFSDSRESISPEVAYMTLNALMGVVDEAGGTAGRLRYTYGFTNQIGGKTGTTQNNSDGWFVGVTPNLVAGAWVGCSDRRMRFSTMQYGQGAALALPIYGLFMKRVYGDVSINLPKDPFTKPKDFKIELNCSVYKRNHTDDLGNDQETDDDYNLNKLNQ